ncbi:peptidase U32 family protein [Ferrimonas senticii]|uniref:peptidase U32 family protein n=1 Tax=Ferrimonas senticii TaxID=394566 RepID=UPI000481509A|nr:U32 family peptidase [Ferrimonas senticii]
MSSTQFELLAPGGDIDAIKAAIAAGADAVYCGLDKFNARNRAGNLDWVQLNGVIRLAHQHRCKIFLTLNIVMLPREFAQLWKLLNQLNNSDIDGVIVQDYGLFMLIQQHFPDLDLHASTQANTHNTGQIDFLAHYGVSRVNLSRELDIDEITALASYGAARNVQMEVFVHGSYCVGFSGLCYLSSHHNGASGNRGRCSQPCRDAYQQTPSGLSYPLNMKDNSAFADLAKLADAGVYSLKIEGRIKQAHYVYSVVDQWRQQIDAYADNKPLAAHSDLLYTVFNRDFSAGYLNGNLSRGMFIDNPKDHSAHHFAARAGVSDFSGFKQIKTALHDVKTDIINHVEQAIAPLDSQPLPLLLNLSGQLGQPLQLTLIRGRGADATVWQGQSSSGLIAADRYQLDDATLAPIFNPLNDANHQLQALQLDGLTGLFLPFAELATLRQQMLLWLRGGKAIKAEVALPAAPQPQRFSGDKQLAVIINQAPSAELLAEPVELYYQLPEALAPQLTQMQALFAENPQLLPCFPAVLIGANFSAAKTLLETVQPAKILTHNSGVAAVAEQLGIAWIAGGQFNLLNGYALAALQQRGAVGAVLSSELSRRQLQGIGAPAGMGVYFSLFHPQALLSSRQCLLRQVIDCRKDTMTPGCLRKCAKRAELRHGSNSERRYIIDKQRGDNNVIYADKHYLSVAAVADLPQLSHGLIDLRQIETTTQVALEPVALVRLFRSLLAGDEGAAARLTDAISNHCQRQYLQGIS